MRELNKLSAIHFIPVFAFHSIIQSFNHSIIQSFNHSIIQSLIPSSQFVFH